jgi:hypothetical protein
VLTLIIDKKNARPVETRDLLASLKASIASIVTNAIVLPDTESPASLERNKIRVGDPRDAISKYLAEKSI